MADLQHNHRGLLTALAGGVAGLGLGAVLPTQETLPAQSGMLYAVQATLRPGQTLEWVMLDLVVHRVGSLKLIR